MNVNIFSHNDSHMPRPSAKASEMQIIYKTNKKIQKPPSVVLIFLLYLQKFRN